MRAKAATALTFSLFAACAATPGGRGDDAEWRELQRERLLRLHAPRPAMAAAPIDASQEPLPASASRREARHIDQREPQGLGVGLRPFRAARRPLSASLAVGRGTVQMHVPGTQLDDRTDAWFAQLALETEGGAGLQAQAWASDDDLFAGQRINDGVAPADADASLRGLEVFPYVRLDVLRGKDWSASMRTGLFADWLQMEHEEAGVDRSFVSIGPRAVFEPRWRLFGEQAQWLDLVGRVGGAFGPTWFAEDFRGGSDRDTTMQWSGELGASLRGQSGNFTAEIGYDLRQTRFESIDGDLYGERGHTDLQRQQWSLGFGVKF